MPLNKPNLGDGPNLGSYHPYQQFVWGMFADPGNLCSLAPQHAALTIRSLSIIDWINIESVCVHGRPWWTEVHNSEEIRAPATKKLT